MHAHDILRRLDALRTDRSNWEDLWERTAEIVWPEADEFRDRREPGRKRDRRVFDATGGESVEKFAAVMESLLTPRQKIWHRLKASDEELNKDSGVKLWFEEVNKILFAARSSPKAGYYSEKHVGYKSLGAFGNECLFIESVPDGGIRYRNRHLGEVWIELDQNGVVDTVYRMYEMTSKAAWQKWGEDLPDRLRSSADQRPWEKHWFVHAVIPNASADPDALDWRRMAYTGYDICPGTQSTIRVGGYEELPYKFARYSVNPREMYGRGPAQLVLAPILGANRMKRDFLRAGHLAVEPPILVHDDGVLGRGSKRVVLRPGALNMGTLDDQMQQRVQPFITGTKVPDMQFMLEQERETIRRAFLVPLYEALLENPQMTATQVLQLVRESSVYMAPMIGRQHSEMLEPQIERELGILGRQGALPPMPPVLQEAQGEYEIVYDSPGTREQRSDEAIGISRTVEMAAPFVELDPSVMDVFKPQETVRELAEINGVSSRLLRSEKELEALAERREQEAREAQALEQAQQAAGAARDLAQAGSAARETGRGA